MKHDIHTVPSSEAKSIVTLFWAEWFRSDAVLEGVLSKRFKAISDKNKLSHVTDSFIHFVSLLFWSLLDSCASFSSSHGKEFPVAKITEILDGYRFVSAAELYETLDILDELAIALAISAENVHADPTKVTAFFRNEVRSFLNSSIRTNLWTLDEYRRALDSVSIVSVTDTSGIITYANDAFCKLSGYDRSELLGMPHSIIRHPDTPKEVFASLWETLKKWEIWASEMKNRKKNGDYFWVDSTIIPVFDEKGEAMEYIAIRHDITGYKDALQNVRDYETALNESSMVLRMDIDGIITYANPYFYQMFQYRADDVIGARYINNVAQKVDHNIDRMYQEIVGFPTLSPDDLEDIWQSILKKKPWRGVIKHRSFYGRYLWCSTTIIPLLDANEDISEFIAIQSDITDIQIAKEQLKKSFKKLKDLDAKKDEFLNIASHELRTPMTVIRGYITMMLDGDAGEISDEAKTYLERVLKSTNRQLNLINDMLDIAKLEAGKQEFDIRPVNIPHCIREVADDMRQQFESKWQSLTVECEFTDFLYPLDEGKFKQSLLNLLSNANKFTPKSGQVRILAKQEITNKLSIRIEDTWIGISKDHMPLIFEKFWQVKNSLTRDINGTWLWLPIVKAIIEWLWGMIRVESVEWTGSSFVIEFPLVSNN